MEFAQAKNLFKVMAVTLCMPSLVLAGGDQCIDCAPMNPYASPYSPSDPVASAPQSLDFSSPFSGGLGASSDVAVLPGYIESPIPMNHFRFRFDGLFDNETPDRAEFFYAQYRGLNADAPGPLSFGDIDAQDYSLYLELAPSDVFSVFFELPYRSVQPQGGVGNIQGGPIGDIDNSDSSGLGDINFGFKYALIRNCESVFTFQMRVYTPTGDAGEGLGTDHVTLEPGLLYQRSLTDRLTLFAEVKDWIPIDGSSFQGRDFSGNVLRYGVGTGYTCYDCDGITITPLVEFVGWTVFDGLVSEARGNDIAVNNADTTIVNAKAGIRLNIERGNGSAHSIYAGFGQALTNEAWYDSIVRVDWGIIF
ncbi:transporter [Thalassoglobus sp. JC818]|uniref:transporter n=1 Tax=Thalassoglobus sp. JC818 TaxID=3232136 RepID=UPI003459C780